MGKRWGGGMRGNRQDAEAPREKGKASLIVAARSPRLSIIPPLALLLYAYPSGLSLAARKSAGPALFALVTVTRRDAAPSALLVDIADEPLRTGVLLVTRVVPRAVAIAFVGTTGANGLA